MESFFSVELTATPLQIFGPKHLTVVAIFVLMWLLFFVLRRFWSKDMQNNILLGLTGVMAVNEAGLHIWSAYWGIWDIQTMLPLHLCSIMIWVTTIAVFSRRISGLYDFLYFLGIGGALQAFLTPADAAMYDIPHYRILQTLIAHGLLISIPIFLTVVMGFRPTLASFKRIFIWTNIYMIVVFIINRILGSNYLFITQKPPSPTLMDVLSPWPWYIPQLELVAFIIFFVLYIPFLVSDFYFKKQVKAVI